MSLLSFLLQRIRRHGPLTVAAYMDAALYHDTLGYYASRPGRSGRTGDFYTSVDAGPLFGELLATEFAEMRDILGAGRPFDLVEAGAGSGRLMRDVLDGPAFGSDRGGVRLHLVERSPAARAAQRETLGPHAHLLASQGPDLPAPVEGVIYANELLDALPAHQVVVEGGRLREVFVDASDGRLVVRTGPPSTPELAAYLERVGARLGEGWRAEIGLAAAAWIRQAARTISRGFLVIVDYGHDARELYSASHAQGTLRGFRGHRVDDPLSPSALAGPGEADITLHVDFTSIRRAAEDEGLETLGLLDQTYFLMGLGIADRLEEAGPDAIGALKRRMAAKTLMLPGGLGSTHKVLILAKGVGRPALRGLSYGTRVT